MIKEVKREPLVMVGVDYRIAPTRYRAALAMDEGARQALVQTLREHGAEGLVVIETCNRTEWLVAGPRSAWIAQLLSAHMWTLWEAEGLPQPFPMPLVAEGQAVVRHLFCMAAGLESFVRGERQIAGQLQRSFHSARQAGTSCGLLNVLGSWAGRVVRRAKRSGAAGSISAGVHLLAVERIEAALGQRRRVGVVGMGEIGQRCRDLLKQHGHDVLCFNRSPGEGWLPLRAMVDHAPTLDALVIATGAPEPWLVAEELGPAWPLLIDIGSPRQVLSDGEHGVLGLDELLQGQRPEDPHMVEALEDQVEQIVQEFSLSQTRRGLRHVVEHNHRTYDRLAYQVLPEMIGDLGDEAQRSLEPLMRDLLREYSREVIRSVEDGARLIDNGC